MKTMANGDPETRSADIVSENMEKLKVLFPEAFTEGKVDFDVLRQLLGGAVNDSEEKYGLNWHGKRRARQLALTPSTGTLRPCPEDSVDWDTTQNLMIEGDNLEVLKLLQKSYAGKIKLIYIDPPYNTGHDFVYADDYQDNIKKYLELTGQIGEGRRLTSNSETSGRFHTNWLNMIYPRLKLARSLLRPNGVIFISISDKEVAALRHACDDIFGQENFFAQIPWQSRTSVQNDTDLSVQHEYLVGYARHRRMEHRRLKESNVNQWMELESFAAYPLPLDETRYANPDGDARGKWKADPFDAPNVRENLTYEIRNPNTGEEHWPPPGRHWRTDAASYEKLLADNRILFGKTGQARPQLKVFYEEKKLFGEVPTSWYDGNAHGTVTLGTQELQELFRGQSPFTFPKPTKLIRTILELAVSDSDIVLDFFAGSGTTGHAVLAQNISAGVRLRYIVVQVPEPLDPRIADHRVATELCSANERAQNIAEITKERLRLAADKLKEENAGYEGDLGFRVFKLDRSNIRAWDPAPDDLEGALQAAIDHIKPGRTEQDILYELLLKLGLDLCVPIETHAIADKTVHSVGGGTLIACLDECITSEDAEPLAAGIADLHAGIQHVGETTVVFRDSAFANDIVKTNVAAILNQRGLASVRSL